jgi:hypothetical protein
LREQTRGIFDVLRGVNEWFNGLIEWRTVSMTELSAEEVYLESLYAIEEKEEIRPVLFDSQVISASQTRLELESTKHGNMFE